VADICASPARIADRQIADLPVLRELAEQDEVPEPTLKRLRVQRRVEDAHIEARRRLDVRNDHVEVIDFRRVDRQELGRPIRLALPAQGKLCSSGRGDEGGRHQRAESCNEIAA
jgi:hypothetical protein